VFGVNVVPLLALLPFVFYKRRTFFEEIRARCLIGFAMGGGMAFYAVALLYSTILQTTLLFYMSPVWATLLARLILKEKITAGRVLAIATGVTGIALILSGDVQKSAGLNSELIIDLNRGDVFALISGLLWGYGMVLVKGSAEIPAMDIVPSQYFWATIISLLLLTTTINSAEFIVPTMNQWLDALPVIVGFYVLIILPTIFICTRCAQVLSPGSVCLLMMSEILVAGISAPLLAGEKVSMLEWMAGLLILSATLIEVFSKPSPDQFA